MSKYNWRCEYCNTGFVQESRYHKHRCKDMERHELMLTPVGQSAWALYSKWLTIKKLKVPPVESFLKSQFFNAFVRFAEFIKQVEMTDYERCMNYMVIKDIPPSMWTSEMIMNDYKRFASMTVNVRENVTNSVLFLFKVCDALSENTGSEVGIDEIFDYLTPEDVIDMLRNRQVSPWLLMHSKKFQQFLTTKTTIEQRMIMTTLINPNLIKSKRKTNPKIVEFIKDIVREANL